MYATFSAPVNKQTNNVCYQLVNVVKELPAKNKISSSDIRGDQNIMNIGLQVDTDTTLNETYLVAFYMHTLLLNTHAIFIFRPSVFQKLLSHF